MKIYENPMKMYENQGTSMNIIWKYMKNLTKIYENPMKIHGTTENL